MPNESVTAGHGGAVYKHVMRAAGICRSHPRGLMCELICSIRAVAHGKSVHAYSI